MHIISVTNIGIIHANLLKDQFQKNVVHVQCKQFYYFISWRKWVTYTSISTYWLIIFTIFKYLISRFFVFVFFFKILVHAWWTVLSYASVVLLFFNCWSNWQFIVDIPRFNCALLLCMVQLCTIKFQQCNKSWNP